MNSQIKSFGRRAESLRLRIESLSSLRRSVALPAAHDISERQWFVLETELKAVQIRLLRRLKRLARDYFPHLGADGAAPKLNSAFGELELEMAKAFAFFDTYTDLLTQRHMPEIGELLAGCDALALDALRRDHPALSIIEPPLVYCDRGFGASTLREGVALPGRGQNPMPLIQIPYARLKEKCNLVSIFHEAGHEAMVRLDLVRELPQRLAAALRAKGASTLVADSFARWSSEIGPDFWGFCLCGMAQSATIREILALPAAQVFHFNWGDPHPPPYLRALMSFDWCRKVWGDGLWDEWEREWLALYTPRAVPPETRGLFERMRAFLPLVGEVLLKTRFRALNGRRLPDLFEMKALAPAELKAVAKKSADGRLNLNGLPPAAQLAVFRLLREEGFGEEKLDRIMTEWLVRLGRRKQTIDKQ